MQEVVLILPLLWVVKRHIALFQQSIIELLNHKVSILFFIMRFEARSRELAMLFNGKLINALTPWRIIVDTDAETIVIRKRNFILIGVDEEVHSFRYVRRVTIDEHLIGADIEIKVVGGTARVFCLSKKDCKHIKQMLVAYNSTKKGKSVIIS